MAETTIGEQPGSSVPISEKIAPPTESGASDSEAASVHTGINEGALVRKLDFRLLPAVGVLYLLSFLDRSNGELMLLPAVCSLWLSISADVRH